MTTNTSLNRIPIMSLFSVGSVFILFQTTSQIATILNKLNYKRQLKRTNMEIFDKNIKQLSFSFFSWSKWRLDQIVYESCPLCPHENTKTNVSHKIDFKDFKTCQFLGLDCMLLSELPQKVKTSPSRPPPCLRLVSIIFVIEFDDKYWAS